MSEAEAEDAAIAFNVECVQHATQTLSNPECSKEKKNTIYNFIFLIFIYNFI